MRTTLDLDDDVLEAARALAAMRKQPMGQGVSELARQGLHQPPARLKNWDGVPVLPKRPGIVVTHEFINRLREEAHEFHEAAWAWFTPRRAKGWVTCPLTENSFLRILGRPCTPISAGFPGGRARDSGWTV